MGAITDLLTFRATKVGQGNPQDPGYWIQKVFGGGQPTASGVSVDETNALKYSAVWAAVNIISGGIGALPADVFKRIERGKERDAEHPAWPLVHNQANPLMSAQTFREVLQAHVLLWGNGYAEIERDGANRPVALWPLLPNKTKAILTKDSGTPVLEYEVKITEMKKVMLPARNVLHIKGLGWDGITGYSVIQFAAENIGAGLAVEDFGARFFSNDATPSGILEHPGTLGDKAAKHLREDWQAKQGGLAQSHRTAVLEEGMQYKQMGIAARDAQLIETRRFSLNDIARWYSVPAHMLGDLERATFSNIEEQSLEFVKFTLFRWFSRWEAEYSWKLFTSSQHETHFVEFLVEAFLRGDLKTRTAAYKDAILHGWMSPNEARAKENMNPYEGGDRFFVPMNEQQIGPDMPSEEPLGTVQEEPPAEEPEEDERKHDAMLTLLRDVCNRATRRRQKIIDGGKDEKARESLLFQHRTQRDQDLVVTMAAVMRGMDWEGDPRHVVAAIRFEMLPENGTRGDEMARMLMTRARADNAAAES